MCLCVCPAHSMQHPINLMLWQNSSSIEWLAQFLDFRRVLITISSCWQSLMKNSFQNQPIHFAHATGCGQGPLSFGCGPAKQHFAMLAMYEQLQRWKLAFSSRKAQVWHNQPKHRSNNQSKHSKQKSAPSKDGNACSHSGTMRMDIHNAFTHMLSMISQIKIMCHPGNWCFFWWINTYQNKSKQVWKEVKKSPKIRQEKKQYVYIYI